MKINFISWLLIVLLQFVFIPVPQVLAYSNPAAVPLLTVANFAALAKTLISSPTGPTVLNDGDLGIDSPGTCTGFESPCTGVDVGTVNNGTIQYQNAVALQGQTDATAAVTNIGSRTVNQTLGANLTGLTLTQGVYEVPAAATNLTGDLTLHGDANAVFIFHLTSTLITNTGSRVLLTGGAQACNVFWKVDSSATFEGTTTMVGTVLASTSISFTGGGATLAGRAIAQTAAVTFNNTTVNNSSCDAAASAAATLAAAAQISPPGDGANIGASGSGLVSGINVTKVPNPSALPEGPGFVTYAYLVTNTGDLPLSQVSLTDNRCAPVTFMSGDRNQDSMLDLDESWTYRCTTLVSRSVTNTVTATGFAEGVTVRDTARATVIVGESPTPTAVPKLPNAGSNPQIQDRLPWILIITSGIGVAFLGLYLARAKRAA